MMDPALFIELDHNSVDKGIACAAILPGLQIGVIFVPLDLLANGISLYFIEIGSEGPVEVEELSPNQLSLE